MTKDRLVVTTADSSRASFPTRSVIAFVVGAVVLRGLCVVAWAFFPGGDLFQQIVRIAVPLAMVAGLVSLNRALLYRDGFAADSLGLGFRRFGWFAIGGAMIIPVLLLMAGALWLLVPFHWESGSLAWSRFGWQATEYFAGNFTEELAFRGYLLLILARYVGMHRALLIVALLFGVFHLPGLSGAAAFKMICTTALWSYLFAYGYLLTGTLWTAVGLHVIGNLVLHQGLGLSGGAALFTPVPHKPWPSTYDPAFWVWVTVSGMIVALLAVRSRKLAARPVREIV